MQLFRTPTFRRVAIAAIACASALTLQAAPSEARDEAFFNSIAGTWRGPGEIVAGKYKGTRFTCNLAGDSSSHSTAGITLDGNCRVGMFTQKMSATVSRARAGYRGRFLDGAAGKGLDIISGDVSRNKVVFGIKRNELNGAMIAHVQKDDRLNVTISVKVGSQLVPVIGMTLSRTSKPTKLGSLR